MITVKSLFISKMWQIGYLPAEILWNSSRSRLAAATVYRTYEIALIEPSVVNIDSYHVMKGMSNGHDKSALFFGYGVNEAEPLIVEISEQNKYMWHHA